MLKRLFINHLVCTKIVLVQFKKIELQRVIDLLLVCLFAGPAILIVGFFYILFKITNKKAGSFLYRGERLGILKTTFNIYKIRTLKLGSEQKIKEKVLPNGSHLELPCGIFLRQTRLDELPQLINILKGEMSFFGPRPVRENVYRVNRKDIPGYDKRFQIKPGLLGPAQIFLPHSAPKKIRAQINNQYIDLDNKNIVNFKLLWLALHKMPLNLFSQLLYRIKLKVRLYVSTGGGTNKRRSRRYDNRKNWIQLRVVFDNDSERIELDLIDINDEAILVRGPAGLNKKRIFQLEFDVYVKKRHKKIICSGNIVRNLQPEVTGKNCQQYVIRYKPVSPTDAYLIDQYILKRSIIMGAA